MDNASCIRRTTFLEIAIYTSHSRHAMLFSNYPSITCISISFDQGQFLANIFAVLDLSFTVGAGFFFIKGVGY